MLTATALLWTRIIAGVLVFLVCNLLYSFWKTRRQVAAGGAWPTVQGEIVESAVKIPAIHREDSETNCDAAIRYRYRTDGKDYESSRVQFGGQGGMTRQIAEQRVGKYPLGSRVPVYYDPRRPAEAVLEHKNKNNLAMLMVFIAVFASIAAVLVAHSIAGQVLYTPGGIPVFAFLLPAAAIMVAIGGIYGYLQMRRQAKASANWPTVTGQITTSAVQVDVTVDSDNHNKEIVKYRPDICFAYKIGGREYFSSSWKWGWTALYGNRASAEAVTAKYHEGQSVPVFYDPADPENAVLETGNRGGAAMPLVLTGLFGSVGVGILWFFISVG